MQWSPWQNELLEEEQEQQQQHQPPPPLQHEPLQESLLGALKVAVRDEDVPGALEDDGGRCCPPPTDNSPGSGSGSASRKTSRGSSAPTLSAVAEEGPLRALIAKTTRLEDDLARMWRFLDLHTEQFRVALQKEAGLGQLQRRLFGLNETNLVQEETAALCDSLRTCVGALDERCSLLEEHVWPEQPCNPERRSSRGSRNVIDHIQETFVTAMQDASEEVHPPPDVAAQ